ncbi:hypothetical protein FPSE_09535 [Fusarium pseudograminearum CS3096]|uniref:Uncharacterized protein n=1 Tax=Fusarium pseudograminearum (strain CS3096) TaxID=1028729 RepID=K3VD43_FUSPC|nr:hypothetical protein FPSE_09535 [Fusarium pseudograminearum CS3096]EKJ70318.1 hypothetical protein FPSE_09535 [Fusarium pseudograminearum CS3096]
MHNVLSKRTCFFLVTPTDATNIIKETRDDQDDEWKIKRKYVKVLSGPVLKLDRRIEHRLNAEELPGKNRKRWTRRD